jgi:hypothetical protein
MALKWGNFDFGEFALLVQRGWPTAEVKNEYSKDCVPLDERLAEILVK